MFGGGGMTKAKRFQIKIKPWDGKFYFERGKEDE